MSEYIHINKQTNNSHLGQPLAVFGNCRNALGLCNARIVKMNILWFLEEIRKKEEAFESSAFYQKIEEGSESSILEALDLMLSDKFNPHVISYREATKGWTYLHYVVDKYQKIKVSSVSCQCCCMKEQQR